MPKKQETFHVESKKGDSDKIRRETDVQNYYKILDPTGSGITKLKSDYHFNPKSVVSIVAKSGSGKTNLALNLVPMLGGYDRILVFCGTPLNKEPIYQEMMRKQGADYFEYYDLDQFKSITSEIPKDEILKKEKILVILDDFLAASKKAMEDYAYFATKSRKQSDGGCTFLIISQSFYEIPKLMRDQVKYVFLMRDFDKDEIRRIVRGLAKGDLTIDQIHEFYEDATKNKEITDFFTIDKDTYHDNLKFRRGFTFNYIINPKARKDFVKIKPHGVSMSG